VSEKKTLSESPWEKGKRGFEDRECYPLALEAMAKIHAFSKSLPSDEKYDLYAQVRRASKGVTGNIAEAYGGYHYLDSLHYYSMAHLINARVLENINQPDFESLYKRMRQAEQGLNGFMAYAASARALETLGINE
jgi:four helix bundle protein